MTPTYHSIAREERSLIRRAQRGDMRAVETLLTAHAPFINKMAGFYSRVDGYDFDDAAQEARFGFFEGIMRFDLSRKTRLITFAAWRMKHHIRRELQNTVGDIRVPVWQQDRHGMRAIRAKRLNEPIRADDGSLTTLADKLVSRCQMPDDDVHENRRQATIKKAVTTALKDLDARELLIARERLSRHDMDQTTLLEIGQRFGVSRERVRQIELRAITKLRLKLAKLGGRKLLAA
jgi:RNA polymerase primary sigma factor